MKAMHYVQTKNILHIFMWILYDVPGAIDADSNEVNITYILVNDGTANPLGYVSLQENQATRFSQKDIEQNRVFFTHHGKFF